MNNKGIKENGRLTIDSPDSSLAVDGMNGTSKSSDNSFYSVWASQKILTLHQFITKQTFISLKHNEHCVSEIGPKFKHII